MNNKTKKSLALSMILLTAIITVANTENPIAPVQLTLDEVESIASCEVKKNNKIIFQCDGEEEKDCKDKYSSLFTGEISIECSGIYVELKND